MQHYRQLYSLPEQQWEILRRRHPGGDAQVKAILASTKATKAYTGCVLQHISFTLGDST